MELVHATTEPLEKRAMQTMMWPFAVHNSNDFSLQQAALFGNAHQPAEGSALMVRWLCLCRCVCHCACIVPSSKGG